MPVRDYPKPDGMTIQEIADELGCSRKLIQTIIKSAFTKIRNNTLYGAYYDIDIVDR